jgi:hypothetical protein
MGRLRFTVASEGPTEPDACCEVFEDVPCSLHHVSGELEGEFEEARISAGVSVDRDDERLVEIMVDRPDDVTDEDSDRLVLLSTFMTAADARRLAAGLTEAADRAEREIVRRTEAPK